MHHTRTCFSQRLDSVNAIASVLIASVLIASVILVLSVAQAEAVPPTAKAPAPDAPEIADASAEGVEAIDGFKIQEGIQCELFAAEPLVANPVAFCIDNRGRFYVCESFRQGRGVTDNRKHDQKWLEADLAAQTVADREAYHKRLLGDGISLYTKYDDRIRVLEDRDGDGKADFNEVFADRFNAIVDGSAAGVLAHGKDVFLTNIPHLWRLRDDNNDAKADERTSLHYGYGVRVAFRGHDLHGLIVGPDGRLYFSIGDRGYNIKHEGKHHFDPASGAVFRCELDGSNLEVFATGLRNPQELAFDEWGNLFTGDNNSDSGDKARWVYVVQGGDTGWRMYYQYLKDRGPFNREKIWRPWDPKTTPAYTVPCIRNFADGPSGLAYYPGTGLTDEFKGRFLLCDFRGGPANSGIRSFRVANEGAFFRMEDPQQPFWRILATDLAFGPDGALYLSDWVNGWNGEGKGRIYRLATKTQTDAAKEVQAFLASDPSKLSSSELARLLKHVDQRVRQASQFELARRADSKTLGKIASDETLGDLHRTHALWGLGQIGRAAHNENGESKEAWNLVAECLGDPSVEIRAQACKVLADAPVPALDAAQAKLLAACFESDSPRVRYFASMLAAATGKPKWNESFIGLLASNGDADPILRHAGIIGLTHCASAGSLKSLSKHADRSVRIAAVVALRKQAAAEVAVFLDDADPQVALEAARAIHDADLQDGVAALAAKIETPSDDDAMLRRILSAANQLGGAEQAEALAKYAAEGSLVDRRADALKLLAAWEKPSPRNYVTGAWRPLDPRDPAPAAAALAKFLPTLLAGPPAVQDATIKAAASLGVKDIVPSLVRLAESNGEEAGRRAQALLALGRIDKEQAVRLAPDGLQSAEPEIRAAARRVLTLVKESESLETLAAGVDAATALERQDALSAAVEMATAKDASKKTKDAAVELFATQLKRLVDGEVAKDTQLDVIEGAKALKPSTREIQSLIRDFNSQGDTLLPSLHGGSAERGKRIFFERTEVSCVRCHQIAQRGGAVGPELTRVAKDKQKSYLLESIREPNKAIAKGFESIRLRTDDGLAISGILKKETEDSLELMTAEGKRIVVSKDVIEARRKGQSAMPEDLVKRLTPLELRDLVEYLSTLK